jgi:hypothetical protein
LLQVVGSADPRQAGADDEDVEQAGVGGLRSGRGGWEGHGRGRRAGEADTVCGISLDQRPFVATGVELLGMATAA